VDQEHVDEAKHGGAPVLDLHDLKEEGLRRAVSERRRD